MDLQSNKLESNLGVKWEADKGILLLEPRGPLVAIDFERLAKLVDPWIRDHGKLHGIVIHADKFPGWKSFGSFIEHMKFFAGHHEKVERIAIVSEGKALDILPRIGTHFINAEVRHFPYDELYDAEIWVATPGRQLH